MPRKDLRPWAVLPSGRTASDWARWCLQGELFGPQGKPDTNRIAEILAATDQPARREIREHHARPILPRHEAFRRQIDALVNLYRRAEAAARKYGDHPQIAALTMDGGQRLPRSFNELLFIATHLWGSHGVALDEQDPRAAIDGFVRAVEMFVTETYPALGELPWTRDWILALARYGSLLGAPSFVDQGCWVDPWLSGLIVSRPAETVTLTGIGDAPFRQITINVAGSAEEARENLRFALKCSLLTARVTPSPDDIASFAVRAEARLDEALAGRTFPRRYSNYVMDQVRRDVALWVRVHLDGESFRSVADDANTRRDSDLLFRAAPKGPRILVPPTASGVHAAVKRANDLLTAR